MKGMRCNSVEYFVRQGPGSPPPCMHTAEIQKPWSQYESGKTLTNPNEVWWKSEVVALSNPLKGYNFPRCFILFTFFKEKLSFKEF